VTVAHPTRLGRRRFAAIAAAITLYGCASSRGNPTPAVVSPLSGPCYVADTTAPSPDTLYVVDPHPVASGPVIQDCGIHAGDAFPEVEAGRGVVNVPVPPGTDLRDLLDRGIPGTSGVRPDVVVTRDPDVLAYAARDSSYFSVPLPWDRTYILAVPGADSSALPPAPPPDARDALARDAVSADARAAIPPFWWMSDSACAEIIPVVAQARRVVAYPAGDAIARQLAERIAALAASRTAPRWLPQPLTGQLPSPVRVSGVPRDSLVAALASGQAVAAVYDYPTVRPPACGDAMPVIANGALLFLVDSRAHALLRRGSGAAFLQRRDGSLEYVRRPPQ
jgi:hypothetical protein